MSFGFPSQAPQQQQQIAPWSGLPQGGQPWQGGQQQMWDPSQQAPWRLSPWQTQGMPAATPVQQQPQAQAPQPTNPYLSQGTSASIPNFNPLSPGGGLYQQPQQQAPQQPQTDAWALGGSGYSSLEGAQIAQLQNQMANPNQSPLDMPRGPEQIGLDDWRHPGGPGLFGPGGFGLTEGSPGIFG